MNNRVTTAKRNAQRTSIDRRGTTFVSLLAALVVLGLLLAGLREASHLLDTLNAALSGTAQWIGVRA